MSLAAEDQFILKGLTFIQWPGKTNNPGVIFLFFILNHLQFVCRLVDGDAAVKHQIQIMDLQIILLDQWLFDVGLINW